MTNTATLPDWPAGHRITGDETAQLLGFVAATATDGGAWADQEFFRTANQLLPTNTTLTNDNTFIVPLVANATYRFHGYFAYASNATALYKCGWTTPAGATGAWATGGYPSSVTAASGITDLGHHGITTTLTLGVATANTDFMGAGFVANGATAGNLVFQFAQSVSNAVSTGPITGSWLSVRRVA